MSRSTLLSLIAALALIGLADSWYLAESAATGSALICDVGAGLDGCNIVAQSPYSKFLGIPLAYLGVAFYAGALILSGVAAKFNKPLVDRALFAVSLAGALASVVFLYIQFVLIQALCVYCIISAVVAFLSAGLTWLLLAKSTTRTPVLP